MGNGVANLISHDFFIKSDKFFRKSFDIAQEM